MTLSSEIDKIKETIRQIEDPAAAMALRHVCKALEEIQGESRETGERRETERTERESH